MQVRNLHCCRIKEDQLIPPFSARLSVTHQQRHSVRLTFALMRPLCWCNSNRSHTALPVVFDSVQLLLSSSPRSSVSLETTTQKDPHVLQTPDFSDSTQNQNPELSKPRPKSVYTLSNKLLPVSTYLLLCLRLHRGPTERKKLTRYNTLIKAGGLGAAHGQGQSRNPQATDRTEAGDIWRMGESRI